MNRALCFVAGQNVNKKNHCPTVDPKFNSDSPDHLRKTVAQNCSLKRKPSVSVVKLFDSHSVETLWLNLFSIAINAIHLLRQTWFQLARKKHRNRRLFYPVRCL